MVSAEGNLPFPFTAEEIRDAMPEGLVITLAKTSPAGDQQEIWKVESADAEGVSIEYTVLDGDGAQQMEPVVQRALWTELRDHATFSTANAKRQETRRTTALGELDGWLYTTEGPVDGTRSEMFFATKYPGAPVQMKAFQDGVAVVSMEQVKRQAP